MVAARSVAMTYNRIVDAQLDARNPRTSARALPAGLLSVRFATVFTAASAGLLVLAAWQLNPLCFALSPLALALLFFYSYTKRFTSMSHLVLGACLGLAPIASWIAVRGTLDWPILLLGAAVALWTAGFDIIYACQDLDFDRRTGLFSLPSRLGVRGALRVSHLLHVMMLLLLALGILLRERGLTVGAANGFARCSRTTASVRSATKPASESPSAAAGSGLPITAVPTTEDYVTDVVDWIRIQHVGQTVLVVSHSNTVPWLMEALGASPVPTIEEEQYDRLFVVTVTATGAVTVRAEDHATIAAESSLGNTATRTNDLGADPDDAALIERRIPRRSQTLGGGEHAAQRRTDILAEDVEATVPPTGALRCLRVDYLQVLQDALDGSMQTVQVQPVEAGAGALGPGSVPFAQPAQKVDDDAVAPHPSRKSREVGQRVIGGCVRSRVADPSMRAVGVRPVGFGRDRQKALFADQAFGDARALAVELVGAVRRLADQHKAGIADQVHQAVVIIVRASQVTWDGHSCLSSLTARTGRNAYPRRRWSAGGGRRCRGGCEPPGPSSAKNRGTTIRRRQMGPAFGRK